MSCPDGGGGLARACAREGSSEHGPDRVKPATELLLEWRVRDLEAQIVLQAEAARAADRRHEEELERVRVEALAVVMERDSLVERLRGVS